MLGELRDAVETAINGTEGVMVTKWILVAEVFSIESGDKELVQVVPDQLKTWDAAGMLWTALHGDVEED